MPVEVALNTPLANALHGEVASKLMEFGWAADPSDSTMTEYIVLMLVNGKTKDEIAAELAGELLGLAPDDPDVLTFAQWLFEQIDIHNVRLNGNGLVGQAETSMTSQDDSATMGDDQEMDLTSGNDFPADINAPKGPKAMRNGSNIRGVGREKRMVGQINRALDRTNEGVLHRVRNQNGISRIDSHGRGTPTGPRMGMGGRQPRTVNNRAASLAHGMAAAANGMMGMPGFQGPPGPMGPGMNGNWMMGQPSPQQPDMVAMIEAQSRLLQQMSDQLQVQQQMNGGRGGGFNRGVRLSDRVQRGRGGYNRGGRQHHHNGQGHGDESTETTTEGADVDMSGAPRESTKPEDTVCRYNFNCTNKDCKFAHQSPAAPPNTSIDVSDLCSFGAACKNKKCVARHPSPASRLAHQSELDCKFWPNCTNARCPFKHPTMPPCRNGGDCKTPNCRFTHLQTDCKFNPCTNRYCPFKHTEGQRGTFQDKVWTAESAKDHVSERKFVDEDAPVDNVLPDQKGNGEMDTDVPIIT